MKKVWHYAPWAYLPEIVQSGSLLASNAGTAGERPMLWFSAHQVWEPTATKLLRAPDGKLIPMTFAQQAQSFGCIRFGLPAHDVRLLPWSDACFIAGTRARARRALERTGRLQHANPDQWFATIESLALSELHFQVWLDGWRDATSSEDMAATWQKTQEATVVKS
jgi:hypothetical protein